MRILPLSGMAVAAALVLAPVSASVGEAFAGDAIAVPLNIVHGVPLVVPAPPRTIVPPAWGYGTYGVPTVAGIHAGPVAQPVVHVIESAGVRRRARGAGHATSRAGCPWRDVPRETRASHPAGH